MKPDYLFITAGVSALGLVAGLAVRGRCSWRQTWCACLLWACFGAGLLVQGLAPHLPIRGDRFVMPSHPGSIALRDPVGCVERERQMHLFSALLTTGAALGLTLRYRQTLFRSTGSQVHVSDHRKPAAS
jgi:hypothetical protein